MISRINQDHRNPKNWNSKLPNLHLQINAISRSTTLLKANNSSPASCFSRFQQYLPNTGKFPDLTRSRRWLLHPSTPTSVPCLGLQRLLAKDDDDDPYVFSVFSELSSHYQMLQCLSSGKTLCYKHWASTHLCYAWVWSLRRHFPILNSLLQYLQSLQSYTPSRFPAHSALHVTL